MLRLRSNGRGDEGVSAVEFAIVVPVLLVLLLGILEFAFVMRDSLSVSSSVRTGVRIAATGAGAGPCQPVTDPTLCGTFNGNPVPANVPLLAQRAADSIQRAGSAMQQDLIDFIWVYKANTNGFPGSATTLAAALAAGCAVTADCVAYRWVDAQDRFRFQSGSWVSSTINACVNNVNAQSVGVMMQATHPFITGFFRRSLTLTERSVAKFEPLPTGECASGDHP